MLRDLSPYSYEFQFLRIPPGPLAIGQSVLNSTVLYILKGGVGSPRGTTPPPWWENFFFPPVCCMGVFGVPRVWSRRKNFFSQQREKPPRRRPLFLVSVRQKHAIPRCGVCGGFGNTIHESAEANKEGGKTQTEKIALQ